MKLLGRMAIIGALTHTDRSLLLIAPRVDRLGDIESQSVRVTSGHIADAVDILDKLG